MTIKTETDMHDVSLSLWRGGWNAGYEPDCLNDLDPDMMSHWDREEEACVMTNEEFNGLCSFWRGECGSANSGIDGDVLQALSADEIERGDKWVFSVD